MSALSVGADPTDATAKSCPGLVAQPGVVACPTVSATCFEAQGAAARKFVVVDPRITPTVEPVLPTSTCSRAPVPTARLASGIACTSCCATACTTADFCRRTGPTAFDELQRLRAGVHARDAWRRSPGVPAAKKLEAAVQAHLRERPLDAGKLTQRGSRRARFQRGQLPARGVPDHRRPWAGNLDVTGGMAHQSPGLPFDYVRRPRHGLRLEWTCTRRRAALQAMRSDKDDFPVWAHYNKMIQVESSSPSTLPRARSSVMHDVGRQCHDVASERRLPESHWQAGVFCGGRLLHSPVDAQFHGHCCFLWPCATSAWRRSPSSAARSTCASPWCRPRERRARTTRSCSNWAVALGLEEDCFGGSVEAALENILQTTGLGITLQDLRDHPEGYVVPSDGKPTRPQVRDGRHTLGRAARLQHAQWESGIPLPSHEGMWMA